MRDREFFTACSDGTAVKVTTTLSMLVERLSSHPRVTLVIIGQDDVNVTTATTRYRAELRERNAGNIYAAKPRSGGAGTKIINRKHAFIVLIK